MALTIRGPGHLLPCPETGDTEPASFGIRRAEKDLECEQWLVNGAAVHKIIQQIMAGPVRGWGDPGMCQATCETHRPLGQACQTLGCVPQSQRRVTTGERTGE